MLATVVTKITALIDRYNTSFSYRAERHYMRGPGPACERKKSSSA
jgi:hypothetical protein